MAQELFLNPSNVTHSQIYAFFKYWAHSIPDFSISLYFFSTMTKVDCDIPKLLVKNVCDPGVLSRNDKIFKIAFFTVFHRSTECIAFLSSDLDSNEEACILIWYPNPQDVCGYNFTLRISWQQVIQHFSHGQQQSNKKRKYFIVCLKYLSQIGM